MPPRIKGLSPDEAPEEFGDEEGNDADREVALSDLTGDEGVELTLGYIRDYISGRQVRATPEEVQAVQVFARRLVEDYGYPKDQIITHPQYRVRRSPSDTAKSFPVDIAVFATSDKREADLHMIVECKKKNRQEGIEQLKLYLSMSAATIGVWFNGSDHHYARKIHHPDGSITWQEPLPNIPKAGQRIEDIGL